MCYFYVLATSIRLDGAVTVAKGPDQQLADVNMSNNVFPREKQSDKFEEVKDA